MKDRSRPLWEWLVFGIVVALAFILTLTTVYYERQLARQQNLFYQLQLLRTASILYKVVNKENANNLSELVEGTFQLPDAKTTFRYIKNPPKLVGGKLLDPFGNFYWYDPSTGWIKSMTPGYEFW